MKRFVILILLSAAVSFQLHAQNNPYDIDDECYVHFREAESLVSANTKESREKFAASNEALLNSAIKKGDKKAQVLYYVNQTKFILRTPDVADEQVDKAHETLCDVALKLGYKQYYYYSFELVQNYYYNHDKYIKAAELLLNMESKASEENDEYGLWVGTKYLSALFMSQRDYATAKQYILRSLAIYENSHDPVTKRQSVCRQYCDLSDCYLPHEDSMRINIIKALGTRRAHLDTVRCEYYLAKLTALDKDFAGFLFHRDNCISDPSFPGTLFIGGLEYFEAIESIMRGNPQEHMNAFSSLGRYPQQKFIADLAEEYGFHDISTKIHHEMIHGLEESVSSTNRMRLTETAARLGNFELSSSLAVKSRQVEKVTRILIYFLTFIFVVSLLFLLLRTRSLRKKNERDRRMIEELRAANERAQVADAAKTRFVQNMSHEVRTPLNAIVGFSQLLSLPDGSFPEEEKEEFSRHIVNNTKMLTMLLDDILSTSQMDSGGYKVTIEDGECHYICESAISSSEHRLQPGVTMSYAPESKEPFVFRTDPRRAQQILINLLTNACKHTTKGQIVLTSSLSENPGEVTFSVTDTGPGVPDDQAEKIFDRFTKLNEFVQGTGLGLSICREIATKMGGRVFLDTSYKAGGARFVFVLPTVPPQDVENKQL